MTQDEREPLHGSLQAWRDAVDDLPSALRPDERPGSGPLTSWWQRTVRERMRRTS